MIQIKHGDIEVINVTGVVEENHFYIRISCVEKYFEVSDLGDTFALCVTKGCTLRNGEVLRKEGPKGPTMVHLNMDAGSADWHVKASTSGYGVTLVGVRCPIEEAKEIKFSIDDDTDPFGEE